VDAVHPLLRRTALAGPAVVQKSAVCNQSTVQLLSSNQQPLQLSFLAYVRKLDAPAQI
jgi:hypothetical protein